jgi:hypothetical protein
MKVYEAKLKPDTEVEAFSLVLGAAVETKLQKFAEEVETPVFFANEEKRIIFSVALRPDKLIFRKDVNGEPANVFFSKETVEKLQQSFFKNNAKGKAKFNINHAQEFSDVYPIESWIVNDPEIDKSKTLLMTDVQEGDLILGYKIDNDEVWEKFVKTGEVDGLSVEAFLDYEILKPQIMNEEEKKSFMAEIISHVKALFQTDPPQKTKEELEAEEKARLEAEASAKPPAENWEEKYNQLMSENADLKEKLAEYQAKEIEANTALETMKAQIQKFAIDNKPNEVVKDWAKMTPLEKFRATK